MYSVSDKEDDAIYAVIVNDAKVETKRLCQGVPHQALHREGETVVYNIDEDYYDDLTPAENGQPLPATTTTTPLSCAVPSSPSS